MSHIRPYLALPLVFSLTALAAWLSGAAVERQSTTVDFPLRTKRSRDSEPAADAAGSAAVVAEFEQEMLRPSVPPAEVHDADWMESLIAIAKNRAGFVACGGSEFEQAYRWAREDPEAMFAWLVHKGGSAEKDRVSYASILFGEWAKTDMKAALAATSRIPGVLLRRQSLASCLEELAVNNPSKARELLLENLDLFADDGNRSGFDVYPLGKSTCAMLLTLPAGETRTHLLAGMLADMARWPGDEAKEAVIVWEKSNEDFRRELVAAGFKCGKDAAARFAGLESLLREHAESTGKRDEAENFLETCGTSWVARDFPAALEWTMAHLKGAKRVDQSVALFGQAAGRDFDTTAETWQQLPQGILKARAAGAILRSAPADRKVEAESLVQSLSEHDQKVAR